MGNECSIVHDDKLEECIHHWLIDANNSGVCKKCGAKKHFSSSWSTATLQGAWGSRSVKARNKVEDPKS